MKRKMTLKTLGLCFILIAIISGNIGFADTITVETGNSQGALMYGGIGFLYGLGLYTPEDWLITGLGHPQITCQNAPNGLQHPDGYADDVAPQWKRCGGKRVNIYCQDIYSQWPYQWLGINDYLNKLDTIANTIKNDPNRTFFSYTIFNEPDQIWYANYGTGLTNMCNDWKLCYNKIKSIDSTAKITGPGFAGYHSAAYRTFLTFCRNNNCLPDYISWHELGDSFFSGWYDHYNDLRDIESDLGIGHREIVINEYCRGPYATSQDLTVPGNCIQFLTRFENSNVYGCRAYWTGHGTLNDLVANNNIDQHAVGSSYNQPTGVWYLYQWYGQMSGNQVQVNPPSQNGSLQGMASKDGDNVTVLFGGHLSVEDNFNVDLVVRGLSSSSVDYTVWVTNDTGRNTASSPSVKTSGSLTVSSGQVTIPVSNCYGRSAYKVYITPGSGGSTPTPEPTPTPTPGEGDFSGYYMIVARHSNKAADVYGGTGATGNGVNICQWSQHGAYNQQWEAIHVTGDYYKLKARHSGKLMEVANASTSNGGNVQQWEDNGNYCQQWAIESVGGGYYRLINRNSGKALDVSGASTSDGANILQWTYNGAYNQQWQMIAQ